MTGSRLPRALAVAGLAAALAVATAIGFEAGRRYPFDSLRRFMPVRGNAVWHVAGQAPFKVYEAAVTTAGDTIFVFGGFVDDDHNASRVVWTFDVTTRTWGRRADMPTPFTHANAVRVGRRVWFVGGFLGRSPGPGTQEVWSYDLDADRWQPGTPLPEIRASGGLVLLANQLHYFGGYKADRMTTASTHWALDLDAPDSTRQWVERAPLPVARGHMSAASLGGYAYAIGGAIGHDPNPLDVADVHRYDPATDAWTAGSPLPVPRSHAEPSTLVHDGRIIVIGGRSRPNDIESSADVAEYDPVTDTWTALTSLPEGRLAPITAAIGGKFYVIAGGDNESLPRSRTAWVGEIEKPWQPAAPVPAPLGEVAGGVIGDRLFLVGDGHGATMALNLRTGRWDPPGTYPFRISNGHHHAAEVLDGKLWLFGGIDGGTRIVQVFDPARGTWAHGPPIPFYVGSTATAVIGGSIYMVGGIMGDTTTRMGARLDPATGTWTPIAPMPLARNHAAAGTDGVRLYIFGGRGPGSGDGNHVANGFDEVQIYDPSVDRWTVSGDSTGAPARLPQARGGMGKAAFVDGEFWIMGGETLNGPGATRDRVYDRVDIYSPSTNTWREGPRMPTARHGIFPLVAGHRIWVAGGGTRAGWSLSDVVDVLDPRRVPRNTGR